MDARADTSSGRFGGQWAFLSTPPHHGSRSLPPSSSYLRSDRSNVSPLPNTLHFHQLNASRSSLNRHVQTPSIGGRSSTTTIPSQPVLVRVHSDDASLQIRPPRPRSKQGIMNNELPPPHEFSFRGILAAIEEDIDEDVNAISEILGRSRLVLADQHESHLPPQGEIRALGSPLQAVAEASASNERLAGAADDVIILREDASLVDGSHTGSAAYGLLERLQAVPRSRRRRSETPGAGPSRPGTGSMRHTSAPAVLSDMSPIVEDHDRLALSGLSRSSHRLLQSSAAGHEVEETPSRATNAVVSETYLSAGANAVTISDPPIVSEGGRHYPLYSFDDSGLFEGPAASCPPPPTTLRERLQSLIPRMELHNFVPWVHGQPSRPVSAESQLRDILDRNQRALSSGRSYAMVVESLEMYE
ncbi:hypothetical protein AYL99_03800 [Fonsecaea erecta]|uniref:Uncharacterized protein n=1 Tax=Fonsecaea erecta TaxID=1367422 RepID=A0A178ZP86_9EURO|nr:hypothetical protein AYL99_03800 [Fonsecaea erecta]OAP61597.1 hypothetical protein AYL99_03800 [Fonsecaea erecta]